MRAACATEIDTFCAPERDLLAALQARHVRRASIHILESVLGDCMAEHRAELSPHCVQALDAQQTAEKARHGEHEDADGEEQQQPDEIATPSIVGGDSDLDSDAPPKHKPSTDAKSKDRVEIVDVAPQMPPKMQLPPVQIGPTTQQMETAADEGIEVRVFFINHHVTGAKAGAASPYLRVGEAAQYSGGHGPSTSMLIVPWLGLLILPFFAIGLYITVTRAMTFFRRRRDVLYQVQSSSSSEYQTIPTSKLLPHTS